MKSNGCEGAISGDLKALVMLSSSMGKASKAIKPRAGMRAAANGFSIDLGLDLERMATLVTFTARSMRTDSPRPFGASIVDTKTGVLLLRALNAVKQENDPSAHAEVRAIRKATKRLKQISLAGYTLYTTCEPCPMCMSTALWAGLDRVVYGATIEDANGPLMRDECYALFTHPQMLRAFSLWQTRKRS